MDFPIRLFVILLGCHTIFKEPDIEINVNDKQLFSNQLEKVIGGCYLILLGLLESYTILNRAMFIIWIIYVLLHKYYFSKKW